MTIFQAAVLGLVQGLSEFLPISSSAHLLMTRWFLGWEDPGLSFDVALHLGTLIGVFIYFWNDIIALIKNFIGSLQGGREPQHKLPWFIIGGTIPAAILGFVFEHKAETVFRSPWVIPFSLALFGLLLWAADRFCAQKKGGTLSLKQAILVGASQGIAVIPGVSRSGISVTTGLFMGLSREEAVRFSFLLSIPLIAGAGVLKIKHIVAHISDPVMMVGIATSAISGYAAILFLMNLIKTKSLAPFSLYRLSVAAALVLWLINK